MKRLGCTLFQIPKNLLGQQTHFLADSDRVAVDGTFVIAVDANQIVDHRFRK